MSLLRYFWKSSSRLLLISNLHLHLHFRGVSTRTADKLFIKMIHEKLIETITISIFYLKFKVNNENDINTNASFGGFFCR